MNDDKELTLELIRSIDKRNKLMDKALNCAVALFIILLVCFTVIITTTVVSYNNALVECTRLYFVTDYSYPSIEQTVDVRGDN